MTDKTPQYIQAQKTGDLLAQKNALIEQQATRIRELETALEKIYGVVERAESTISKLPASFPKEALANVEQFRGMVHERNELVKALTDIVNMTHNSSAVTDYQARYYAFFVASEILNKHTGTKYELGEKE